MSNYHIYIYVILNLLIYSLVNRSDICLYLIPVKLSLRVTSFSVSKFSEFFQLKCSNLMLPDINFFHLTLPVVLLFVGDWMTPTPSHRAHPFRRGERGITVYLYPESILLLLRYLIWSSFQYLVLTYILVTYFSTHACLAWNQLSSSYPTSYIAVAWRLDDAHPFPGPTHSTGGRGDDGLWPWHTMTMTMAGGVGGGPGTWNIYCQYRDCEKCYLPPFYGNQKQPLKFP